MNLIPLKSKKYFNSKAGKFFLESYLLARSAVYTLESLPLIVVDSFVNNTNRSISAEQKKMILEEMKQLIKSDVDDCAEGYYEIEEIFGHQAPSKHIMNYAEILKDSLKVSLRKKNNDYYSFSESSDSSTDYPAYYKRNFHFQTDGYLSSKSSQLYEQQVEILFRGMAMPMRRRIIKPLVDRWGRDKKIKILEIGSGNGIFTELLTRVYPNAEITIVEMSASYLKDAEKRLSKYKNINFFRGEGENLLFKDQTFDLTISSYLFHELPMKIRKDVIAESLRVTKKGGAFAMLDSIQCHDNPNLNWAIESFPLNFHEPFYYNYIKNPVENILKEKLSDTQIFSAHHLLSKVIVADV